MRSRWIWLVGLCMAFRCVEAQQADLAVSYCYHSMNRFGKETDKQMLLLANAAGSKYYNTVSEYLDSLKSTPEGRALHRQLLSEAARRWSAGLQDVEVPHKPVTHVVFKSATTGRLTYYDAYNLLRYYYEEPLDEQQWTIVDTTKTVLGYECVQATTEYHGRTWTAWFAPDIPLSDGPWKLCGLPGLILEATEAEGRYSFVATGIGPADRPIVPMYEAKVYERKDRKDMLRKYRDYLGNPMGTLRAIAPELDTKTVSTSADEGLDPAYDFIETDYR